MMTTSQDGPSNDIEAHESEAGLPTTDQAQPTAAALKSKIVQRIEQEIADRTAQDGFETLADPYYKSGGSPYYYKN